MCLHCNSSAYHNNIIFNTGLVGIHVGAIFHVAGYLVHIHIAEQTDVIPSVVDLQ